jgi:LacI family transcriptional regulator, galactose operon repressor
MRAQITLQAIARKSGVSLTTVSLVLRDKPGINEATRKRVLDAASALGYRRRLGLVSAPSPLLRQVGVVLKARAGDAPYSNQFYAPVLAGVEAACRKQQINMLYATVRVDIDNHPQDVPRMLLEGELDGVLLIGAFVDNTIEQLIQRRGMPVVLVDAYAPGASYDAAVTDNVRGAYEAVAYLIRRGHRHIGMVGSLPDAFPSIEERRRGYVQALLDNNISERYFADSHLSTEEAAESTAELLRRYPHVTALFCGNDITAVAAMQAARAAGRRLPEDLSIIGFDNIDLAEHMVPALTTMHVDKSGLGRLAVQLLANRAEFPDAGCVTAVLQPTMVERQSVCAITPVQ